MSKDLYDVLGVSRDAADADIKRAYRKLARQFHPDVNKDAGAEDRFKEIQRAYGILSDSQKRGQYDQFGVTDDQPGAGAGGFGGFSSSGFSSSFDGFDDIFESFFGGQRRGGGRSSQRTRSHQGEDLRYDLSLNLEDIIIKKTHTIDIFRMDRCKPCKGSGAKSGTSKSSCSQCHGQGQVRQVQQTMLGSFAQVVTCPACEGAGEMIKSPCKECSGSGLQKERKTIDIDVPAGVDDEIKLRISDEGNVGRNGGPKGDLFVYISINKHPFFRREQDDIYLEVTLPMSQVVLGAEIKVPTLDGHAIVKIPSGTQPNTSFRLKGKGIPHLRGFGSGDQHVIVHVDIPKSLTHDEKDFIESFSVSRKDDRVVKELYNTLKKK